jgi:acyl-coenzyme A synthetase/AMP-(fatty) acid ligase/acyl carrier protein
VTIWDTIPTFWQHSIDILLSTKVEHRALLLDNRLRLILTTGEVLRWDVPQAWQDKLKHQAKLINLYSQTETAGSVAYYPIPAEFADKSGAVPLGRPLENAQIYLLDEQLKPVPLGETGELYVGGSRLARGYLNQPDLTAEKFISNPFSSEPNTRLYKTGDLARYLPDGTLETLGRSDFQVKIRGFRVELSEVEAAIDQHAAISKTIVAAHPPENPHLIAYLVPQQGQLPTVSELHNFLKTKLPDYMIPATFIFIDAFPLNPNDKLDRQALPAPGKTRPILETAYQGPESPLEVQLITLFAELLNIDRVGVNDNFFELGGHSLLATKLISRIRNIFKVEISLRRLFKAPTVTALARNIIDQQLATTTDDEMASLLADLNNLSDEEVAQLLAQLNEE